MASINFRSLREELYIKRGRLKEGMGRVLNKGRLLWGWGESNKYKLKIMVGGGGAFI